MNSGIEHRLVRREDFTEWVELTGGYFQVIKGSRAAVRGIVLSSGVEVQLKCTTILVNEDRSYYGQCGDFSHIRVPVDSCYANYYGKGSRNFDNHAEFQSTMDLLEVFEN